MTLAPRAAEASAASTSDGAASGTVSTRDPSNGLRTGLSVRPATHSPPIYIFMRDRLLARPLLEPGAFVLELELPHDVGDRLVDDFHDLVCLFFRQDQCR